MLNDWLSKIIQDRAINYLSIPGTHDAASVSGASIMPLTITQRIDVTGQLNSGVRVLDMRVAHKATVPAKAATFFKSAVREVPEDIHMCHGPIVFDTKLSEQLGIIKTWLGDNPTEFVAMIFQQQGTKSNIAIEKPRVTRL